MDSLPWLELQVLLRPVPRDEAAWKVAILRVVLPVAACALREANLRPLRLWGADDLADAVLVELEANANLARQLKFPKKADPDKAIRRYIETVTKRVWKRFHREEARQHRQSKGQKPASAPEDRGEVSPEQVARREKIRTIVATLSEKDQLLIQWRFTDDLSLAEIAEKLGITEHAAKERLHRVEAKVKALIGDEKLF